MPVEKSYKVFTYRMYRQFTQQCTLIILPNFPGATFIQGGTFIPDSRVCDMTRFDLTNGKEYPTNCDIKWLVFGMEFQTL